MPQATVKSALQAAWRRAGRINRQALNAELRLGAPQSHKYATVNYSPDTPSAMNAR